jgi:hypothetical protein
MQVTCALQKVHHQRRVIEMLIVYADGTPDEKAHSALERGSLIISLAAHQHQPPTPRVCARKLFYAV